MKQAKEIILTLLAVCLFMACSSDEESDAYQYEESPVSLDGTWHLAGAYFSFDGVSEFKVQPGDVTVSFNPDRTMLVVNKSETSQMKQFYASGLYSYEVISSQTSPSDGTVFTLISIEGQKCTYWFRDGMLTLDFGMAYDAPGYYFKKLKK